MAGASHSVPRATAVRVACRAMRHRAGDAAAATSSHEQPATSSHRAATSVSRVLRVCLKSRRRPRRPRLESGTDLAQLPAGAGRDVAPRAPHDGMPRRMARNLRICKATALTRLRSTGRGPWHRSCYCMAHASHPAHPMSVCRSPVSSWVPVPGPHSRHVRDRGKE